jgi:2-deoxy-D-gluconate 3-dehydrogenase
VSPTGRENPLSLKGRTALITGAGRGIGRAIALAYADAGADLILCSRTTREVEALADEARARGIKAEARCLDVSSTEQCRAVASDAIAQAGRIDVLVNNAGTAIRKLAPEITEADWDVIFGTNLKGPFFLTQAIGQHMVARGGGCIINISSIAAIVGSSTRSAYAASKAGLAALTRALAVEWGPHGVTVNAIAPGFIRTSLTESLFSDPATLATSLTRTPLGRFPEPVDVARAALYLASDAGRNVTGQLLTVDGGFTIAS